MSSNISRRNITKSAAWSVPVITIAGAAPATAASPTDDKTIVYFGDAQVAQGGTGWKTGGVREDTPLYVHGIDGVGVAQNDNKVPVNLTNVSVTFYFASTGLTFINDFPTYEWSDLVEDGTTYILDGKTLYGYTAKYAEDGTFSSESGDVKYTPLSNQFAYYLPRNTDVGFPEGSVYAMRVTMLDNGTTKTGITTSVTGTTNNTNGANAAQMGPAAVVYAS